MARVYKVVSTPAVFTTTSQMTAANWWDHFLARMGIRRGQHRVAPGLYALGKPTVDSPVFVTANYSLSFDVLRTSLKGIDGYILVLDTRGVNVWCAAGKRTFGTREVIRRVKETQLGEVVKHRKLILPQLGAPGVAAFEVKKQTGFVVEYGPVRAADLPEYLKTHQATPEMRRVHFPLQDRVILIPVDAGQAILPALVAMAVLYLLGGLTYALVAGVIFLAGTVLFPILLPWLPSHNFSTKGFVLGGLAALPFVLSVFLQHPDWNWYRLYGQAIGFLLVMVGSTAYISLNFTGSTTFTSRTGVKQEIFTYIPAMAWTFGSGILLMLVFAFVR